MNKKALFNQYLSLKAEIEALSNRLRFAEQKIITLEKENNLLTIIVKNKGKDGENDCK